jgi:hypothetical protein
MLRSRLIEIRLSPIGVTIGALKELLQPQLTRGARQAAVRLVERCFPKRGPAFDLVYAVITGAILPRMQRSFLLRGRWTRGGS